MENLVIAALLVLPPLLVAALHRTSWHWLAGALLISAALYMFSHVAPVDADESDPGLGGIANFFLVLGGLGLALYGTITLFVSTRLRNAYLKSVENLPPAATVVAGVNER